MGKQVPNLLHVNSRGKKHLLLHSIIYDTEHRYMFYPMDGISKTKLYSNGFLVGKNKGIQLYEDFDEALMSASLCVLGIPMSLIKAKGHLSEKGEYQGKISLSECYLINVKEVSSFLENYCQHCEWFGEKQCYLRTSQDCGDAEREKFSDAVWISNQRESMKQRKEERQRRREARNLAFPY